MIPTMDNVVKTTKEYGEEYVKAGFVLCAIASGKKGPNVKGWGDLDLDLNTLKDGEGLGLIHGRSGTCVVDIDDMVKAEPYFTQHGIDISALLSAHDAVGISSGREHRAKLLYKAPAGAEKLATHRINIGGVELRCAPRRGNAIQDVLPPSVHPETKKPYKWVGDGDFNNLPELPKGILDLWLTLGTLDVLGAGARHVKSDLDILEPMNDERWSDIKSALGAIPSDDRDIWINVGMALQPYEGGYDLWNAWSSKSDEYEEAAIDHTWYSFDPKEITYRSIFKLASSKEYGWTNPRLGVSKSAQAGLTRETEIEEAKNEPLDIDSDEYGETLHFDSRNPSLVIKKFYLGGWVPEGGVTLLSGDGGVGKSFSSLNIAVCMALGLDYGGMDSRRSKVYFVTAEDDKDDVNARIHNICASLTHDDGSQVVPSDLDGWLLMRDVTQAERSVLYDEHGKTKALIDHARRAKEFGARISFFDNTSNLFAADENVRSPVVGFVKCLTIEMIGKDDRTPEEALTLAKKAVFINGHTSKSNTGSQASGSAAWQQLVRSQLFIGFKEVVKGKPHQPVITAVKSNHSARDTSVTLHWSKGAYVPLTEIDFFEDTESKENAMKDFKQLVFKGVTELLEAGEPVSASKGGPVLAHKTLIKHGKIPAGTTWAAVKEALDSFVLAGAFLEVNKPNSKGRETQFYEIPENGGFW